MTRSSGRRGELPAETTSFVGRQRELAQLAGLLGRARLVTLTGPGGVGKTRTAVRAARELQPRFADGVHLVPLSALADPALLPNTVAATLDVPEQAARPAIEAAVEHALAEDPSAVPDPPSQRPGPADGLTPRERQVALLVAEGMTNRQIAAKLGFTSRAQIAALRDSLIREAEGKGA